MTDQNATPVNGAETTPAQSTTSTATTPQGTANAAAMNEATQNSGKVSTMADLKEQAPEVYAAMMKGLAMNICNKMRDHQKRLKEIMRKARSDASG